jgi:hypothetical protein
MIRHILLYKSDKISVYCTPAVEQQSTAKRKSTYVKTCIAAEKTLIKSITRKYPNSKDSHFKFLFKNYKNDSMLGACDLEFDNDVIIELNAKAMNSLCKTVGHELVHARQFLSGQLKYNNRIKYFTYEGDKHKYIYRRQPWELEAYALQDRESLKLKRWLLDHVHYNPKLSITNL